MRRRLDYLCFQPTREGQASYAHVHEIIAGLRRRGWEVSLVEPAHPRPGRLDGFRRAIAQLTMQIRYWVRRRGRPAPFIYIRGGFLTLPTAAIARLAGASVVQEINGPIEDAYDAWPQLRPLHPLIRVSMSAQIRWASAIITVTPGLADYFAALTGRRTGYHVVGNGAAIDFFSPAAADPDPGDPYVAFIGALASWQGIDVAIRATASASWPAGVKLVVAGDGIQAGAVEAAARESHRVRWLGTIAYREAPAFVAGSIAALVPMTNQPRSAHGLSPLKLFEAMASGVAVIASDLPGLTEVVSEHRCGLTFPAGDSEALARAVGELAGDPPGASGMGARGRDAAVHHYSWDRRAQQTERVLLGIAAGTESTTAAD